MLDGLIFFISYKVFVDRLTIIIFINHLQLLKVGPAFAAPAGLAAMPMPQVQCDKSGTCVWHIRMSYTLENAVPHRETQWHTCMIWWVYKCRDLSIAIITHYQIIHLILLVH